MKTPSPQEAAKMTNREVADGILGDLTRFVVNNLAPANFATMIKRALDAKDAALLDAEKNGYERGRKEDDDLLREARVIIAQFMAAADCNERVCKPWSVYQDSVELLSKLKSRLAPSVGFPSDKP